MAEKGFVISKEIIINVPAEKLWEMVGPGFVEVYKWSSNVDHASGKGTGQFEGAVCEERFCDVNVSGFSKISEVLTQYDDTKMNLAYQVNSGMPSFVSKAVNDWTVIPMEGGRSKLVMKATFATKGIMGFLMNGMLKKNLTQTLETILLDAKIYAETGRVSEAKAKRIEKLKKKGVLAA